MNFYAVVFDLDGVLLDSESDLTWLHTALKKTLNHHGIVDSEENLIKIHSKNVHMFDKMSRELGIEKELLWNTRSKNYLNEKISAMKNGLIKPFSDVNCLYDLKGRYSLAIVSNSPQEIVDIFIKEFNYLDLFDCGIGRSNDLRDLRKIKPNSFLFDKLKDKIQGNKFIYIGNSVIDREFAENTGMEFLFLSRFEIIKESFCTLGEIVEHLLSSFCCK